SSETRSSTGTPKKRLLMSRISSSGRRLLSTAGLPFAPALAYLVKSDGQQQHGSARHILPERGNVEQRQAVVENTQNDYSDERADERAFAARQTGSAEHDRCDDGEFQPDGGARR